MQRRRLESEELERTLADVTRALVATLDPDRILLFGSFARGDQNRASDLDLVILAATELPFPDRIGRALEAAAGAACRVPVEPLVYTPLEWKKMLAEGSSFAHHVEQEGRVLYDRRSEPRRGAPVAPPGAA